jgi:hypothetical protein
LEPAVAGLAYEGLGARTEASYRMIKLADGNEI